MRRALAVGLLGVLASASRAQSITAWGSGSFGTVYSTPTSNDFAKVSAGSDQVMALKADGPLVTWGADYQGQVSNTQTATGLIQIACGK